MLDNSDAHLSSSDLNNIIIFAEQSLFDSYYLKELADCARSMRRIRIAVIDKDWNGLQKLAKDEAVLVDLSKFPGASSELSYALKEAHKYNVINNLEKELKKHQTETDNNLVLAITAAEENEIVDVSANQLLECARQILRLRQALELKETKIVDQIISWFDHNDHICPDYVLDQVHEYKTLHKNDALMFSLIKALSSGKATGWVGSLNTCTVNTSELSNILAQVREMKVGKSEELSNLCETAEIIYELRSGQLECDVPKIQAALLRLGSKDAVHPTIIEEVAAGRAEVDNYMTTTVLLTVIKSFADTRDDSVQVCMRDYKYLLGYEQTAENEISASRPLVESILNCGFVKESLDTARKHGRSVCRLSLSVG